MAKRKKSISVRRAMHKRVLLHPSFIFLLLAAGVLLISLSIKALAFPISVTAKVSAPPVKSPARISIVSPAGNTSLQTAVGSDNNRQKPLHTNSKQITLTGDCPKDSHLEIYRNNTFAGATPCIGDPTFSITVDLFRGLNILEAHVFNLTNDEGPLSPAVYISYENPSPLPPSAPSQFVITSDFQYLGFLVGEQGTWGLSFKGGQLPYSVDVTWGDGQISRYIHDDNSTLTITHKYNRPSGRIGYEIAIRAVDADGKIATLQLMTVVSKPSSYQAQQISIANAKRNPSVLMQIKHWLWLAWPGYIIIALMALSYWLGEWEEYRKITARIKRRK